MRLFVDDDIEALNAWYAAHGMPGVQRRVLPTTGFVVEGVAAGFFYRTDSGLALVHHLVTNPAANRRDRHRAVHEIVRACQDLARQLGLAGLLAWTNVPSVIKVATKAGARPLGTVVLLAQEV